MNEGQPPRKTKELILICADGEKGMLDVDESMTLADVRKQIYEELDDDLIIEDFVFHIDGVRVSAKQETRKNVYDFIVGNKVVAMKAKNTKSNAREAIQTNSDSNKRELDGGSTGTHEKESKRVKPNSKDSRVTNNDSNSREPRNENSKVIQKNKREYPWIKMIKKFDQEYKLRQNEHTVLNEMQQIHHQQEQQKPQPLPQQQEDEETKEKEEVPQDIQSFAKSSKPTKEDSMSIMADDKFLMERKQLLEKELEINCLQSRNIELKSASAVSPSLSRQDKSTPELTSGASAEIMASQFKLINNINDVNTCLDKEDSPVMKKSLNEAFAKVDDTSSSFEFDLNNGDDYVCEKNVDDNDDNNNDDNDDDSDDDSDATVDMTGANPFAAGHENRNDDADADMAFDNYREQDDHKQVLSTEISILNTTSSRKNDNADLQGSKDECKIAVEKSKAALTKMKSILVENELLCSQNRRQEWTKEISDLLNDSEPQTIIGVLGNTGVGKSSLLNALLDEASVLPTSGSRGCTAAVVELRFNAELENDVHKATATEVSCYRGDVEFMTLHEWCTELRILVDECSTQEKTIYALQPDAQTAAEAAAAWAKIDQVYGEGTMNRYKRMDSNHVFQILSNNTRVRNLLTARTSSSGIQYNVISVSEGAVSPGSEIAKSLVAGYQDATPRTRRLKKKWAKDFRAKINSFVYRKGNGKDPQTWPLIRKVVLHGPWNCLNTGACLVDLPGVRDANAARAKVSEQYLQNCNQIWVVAPIKRAVDDGTAKELLGEQFKRRLLMDGQYGNVSFICTQTDDCEATEIMRDHEDVARNVEGRWEEMQLLAETISRFELQINKMIIEEEEVQTEWEDANQLVQDKMEEIKEMEDDDDDVVDDNNELIEAKTALENARQSADTSLKAYTEWKETYGKELESLQNKCDSEQRKLKTLCALVRNEYSTKCLQDDFRAGLKDLYRKDDDVSQETADVALPEDFNMDVYCISSNDYLKVQGIKPRSDGPPNTFAEAEHTNIPSLRSFVHDVTKRHRLVFSKTFVSSTSDMMDRLKLLAAGSSQIPSGRSSLRCMKAFESEVNNISDKLSPLVSTFSAKMKQKVQNSLEPALKTGAAKGIDAAMPIVTSWGSKSRRTRQHRSPESNGLYWATYNATVRRNGTFTSMSAGEINMNQELCDPMEKEFSVNWQATLDRAVQLHLGEAESKVYEICNQVNTLICSSFSRIGIDQNRLANMSATAKRSCVNAVKSAFASMRTIATDTQRNLNRSLLPLVTESMQESYQCCLSQTRGAGVFDRMKSAMSSTTKVKVKSMFNESTLSLMQGIDELVQQLCDLIMNSGNIIQKHLQDVYSIYWDDQNENNVVLDPVTQRKVAECRDRLLPELNAVVSELIQVQTLLGIEREALDLDVCAVESLDDKLQRTLDEATAKEEVIDLCDSDEEIDDVIAKLPPLSDETKKRAVEIKAKTRVKTESSRDDIFIYPPIINTAFDPKRHAAARAYALSKP